jgi:hypothetical protein
MPEKIIQSVKAPKPLAGYNQAMKAGGCRHCLHFKGFYTEGIYAF